MKGVMALVALSPIRKAHCTISGEIPILEKNGTKMKDMKVHLAVAETIIRFTSAVKRINRMSIHKLPRWMDESMSAPIMAIHLSK